MKSLAFLTSFLAIEGCLYTRTMHILNKKHNKTFNCSFHPFHQTWPPLPKTSMPLHLHLKHNKTYWPPHSWHSFCRAINSPLFMDFFSFCGQATPCPKRHELSFFSSSPWTQFHLSYLSNPSLSILSFK